jgi:p-aminobenzoyl-glutamate transporter AbgT
LLTFVIVLAGVMSNMASDVGYVLLVPMGATDLRLSVGRHPIAGLAAAFAGVSGGFSANLLLGTIDPLAGGHHAGSRAHHRARPTWSLGLQLLLHGRLVPSSSPGSEPG